MDNDKDQNVYVGDGNILLYTSEDDIAKKNKEINKKCINEFRGYLSNSNSKQARKSIHCNLKRVFFSSIYIS